MFDHILCPADLKERADKAIVKAVQLAHQFGPKITLLNAHEEFMDKKEREVLRVSTVKMKEKFKHISFESRKEIKAVIHELHAEDIEVDNLLHKGGPQKTIVEIAEELGVDLIVICADGNESLYDFAKGSITEQVINKSPCPVLVIPKKE